MQCPKCGTDGPDDNKYCVKCGSLLASPSVQNVQPNEGVGNIPGEVPPINGTTAQPVATSVPAPSSARRGHKKLAMMLAVVIVAVVVVAGVLIVIAQPSSNGNEISNGDYLLYDTTTISNGQKTYGTVNMTFSNVTSTSMDVDYITTVNGQTTSEIDTFVLNGSFWEITGSSGGQGQGPQITSITDNGSTTLSTVYGQRTVEQVVSIGSGYTETDYDDQTTGMPYKCIATYGDPSRRSL